MKSLKPLAGIALVLACSAMLSAFACSVDTTHDVNRASKQFSDDLSTLQSTADSLYQSKDITAAELEAIDNFTIEAAADHKVLTTQLATLPQFTTTNAPQAVAWVQAFVDKVKGANLHVTSKKGQDAVNLFFAGFDAASATLINILTTLQTPKAFLTLPPGHAPRPIPAGADEITIVLAAFAALGKLLTQWKSDGTLTDAQLQAAADAEDDATTQAALQSLKNAGASGT